MTNTAGFDLGEGVIGSFDDLSVPRWRSVQPCAYRVRQGAAGARLRCRRCRRSLGGLPRPRQCGRPGKWTRMLDVRGVPASLTIGRVPRVTWASLNLVGIAVVRISLQYRKTQPSPAGNLKHKGGENYVTKVRD